MENAHVSFLPDVDEVGFLPVEFFFSLSPLPAPRSPFSLSFFFFHVGVPVSPNSFQPLSQLISR